MDILCAEDQKGLTKHHIYQINYREYKNWEERVTHWGDTAAVILSASFVSSAGEMRVALSEWASTDLQD